MRCDSAEPGGGADAVTADVPGVVETNADYHADMAYLSQSRLKLFARDRMAFHLVETGQLAWDAIRPKNHDALNVGSATHAVLLDDRVLSQYHVPPREVLAKNGARSTNAYQDWLKGVGGPEWVLTSDQLMMVHGMAASVRAKMASLLDSQTALIEQSIRWVDGDSGERCKCRPDLLDLHDDYAVIWDIKTYGADVEFARQAKRLNYAVQAAHYIEGVRAWTQLDDVRFYLMAVCKQPPYTSQAFEFDYGRLLAAGEQRQQWLREIAECRDSGDWTNPYEREVTTIY